MNVIYKSLVRFPPIIENYFSPTSSIISITGLVIEVIMWLKAILLQALKQYLQAKEDPLFTPHPNANRSCSCSYSEYRAATRHYRSCGKHITPSYITVQTSLASYSWWCATVKASILCFQKTIKRISIFLILTI